MNIIFYKEWIKTRWYLLLMFVVTLGFAGYSMMRINRVVELKGVEHIWEIMISKDVIFIDLLQYIPVLAGILLALVQFMPEMYHKCLKLTLHLPYSQWRMINSMLLYGLLMLGALLCAELRMYVCLFAKDTGARALCADFAQCVAVVFGRSGFLSAFILDMFGTYMEASRFESGRGFAGIALVFPGSVGRSLSCISALAHCVYLVVGNAVMAFHRTL